jgi:hypothetical protein
MLNMQFFTRGPCIDAVSRLLYLLGTSVACPAVRPSAGRPRRPPPAPVRRLAHLRRPDKRDRRSARRWACGDQAHRSGRHGHARSGTTKLGQATDPSRHPGRHRGGPDGPWRFRTAGRNARSGTVVTDERGISPWHSSIRPERRFASGDDPRRVRLLAVPVRLSPARDDHDALRGLPTLAPAMRNHPADQNVRL